MANHDEKQMAVVKEAIFSQETIMQDNHVCFVGWNGALKYLGSRYLLELSNSSSPDISVILTPNSDPQYDGFTVIQHLAGHPYYAQVMIYNADRISPDALANLIRHEMGHALGLGHSDMASSIMYPIVPYAPKYISSNDLTDLKGNTLYNS